MIQLSKFYPEGHRLDSGEFRIIYQEYRCSEFYRGTFTFEASNGWYIRSVSLPDIYMGDINEFYVRGSDTKCDTGPLRCSRTAYDEICAAVKEYNLFVAPVGVRFND